jgi:hypothetical protein
MQILVSSWMPAACDPEGAVLPGGESWMVPGSRVNHNNGNPSTIEIKLYHFSAAQAGVLTDDSSGNFMGGCFVASAAYGSLLGPPLKDQRKLRHTTGVGSLENSMRTHATLHAAESLWIAPVFHLRTMAHYKSTARQALILLLIVAFIAGGLVILPKVGKRRKMALSRRRW